MTDEPKSQSAHNYPEVTQMENGSLFIVGDEPVEKLTGFGRAYIPQVDGSESTPPAEWEEGLGNYVLNWEICSRCADNDIQCDSTSCDFEKLKNYIRQIEAAAEKRGREEAVTGETSDGYHTFNELYEFRKVYNAALFNDWYAQGKYSVHKSKRHSDGEECFGGGWFIVMATLPTGQISNHYAMKDWDLFQCEEREKADVWDGHTPKDILTRLIDLTPGDEGRGEV